jgi:hypothetical protein
MSDKKIELIAQLLAKAESTTPEEAEALVAAAEKMMIKYAIDQSVIDARRAKKGEASEKIIEHRMDFTGAYRGEMINLAACVAHGLGGLRGMQYTGGKGKVFSYWIVGFESDVQQAVLLVNSLQVQGTVALAEWWKANKALYAAESSYNQEKARRSFFHGFGSGAGARIRESRATIVEEQTAGTALVLVDRTAKVQAYMDEKSLGKGRARSATGRDGAAAQGIAAGRKANTGGKSVSQGRGISA